MKRKAKAWAWSTGDYGSKIRVFDGGGGWLYGEARVPGTQRWITRSLRTKDQATAKAWAKEQLQKLSAEGGVPIERTPTIARVFSAYLAYRTPRKSAGEQLEDHRRVDMWTRWLGGTKNPTDSSAPNRKPSSRRG